MMFEAGDLVLLPFPFSDTTSILPILKELIEASAQMVFDVRDY